ncbi:flavodoxin [Gottschalkia purinilytica]|uniref:Flavodoxin n=1 Tax=Gottschalkia purinilytica TaxID=1503 RepID=A0A0L0WC01_GOTPU|nr:flavodoxin domain-containing protein [Gottschalkia purinilytica]KNF08988.1 flavodoxin [Gottschalkia purinilytica]
MKTLIIFSSKYGSTKKCAELIMKDLKGKVNMINLKNQKCKNVDNYDTVLICGAIYAGKLHSEVRKFVEDNKECLLEKNLGLFICCKEEKEKALEYMKYNIPDLIIQKAFIKEHLGHEINLEKMNFLEKFLLKSIFKIKESYSKVDYDAIKRITNKINEMGVTNG